MFNILQKKTNVERLIEIHGFETAIKEFGKIIAEKIPNKEIAYQFILQELDGASKGNDDSMRFAEESGLIPAEYEGALQNSIIEVDGPDGPQQTLLAMSLELIRNQKLAAQFRCRISDQIMQIFGLGKYSNVESRIDNLMTLLVKILLSDKDVMPTLSSTIAAPASAKSRHVRFRAKNIASAQQAISALSGLTNKNTDDIIKSALLKFNPEENKNRQKIILTELTALANNDGIKVCKMEISPLYENFSWNFEFSEDALEGANELISELFELRGGDFNVYTDQL
jgi:hypothetical protein